MGAGRCPVARSPFPDLPPQKRYHEPFMTERAWQGPGLLDSPRLSLAFGYLGHVPLYGVHGTPYLSLCFHSLAAPLCKTCLPGHAVGEIGRRPSDGSERHVACNEWTGRRNCMCPRHALRISSQRSISVFGMPTVLLKRLRCGVPVQRPTSDVPST